MEKLFISKNLKRELEKRRWNAKTLSQKANISTSRVSDLLAGRAPSIKTLLAVAKALDISVDELINENKENIKIISKTSSVEKICSIEDNYKITITISKVNNQDE